MKAAIYKGVRDVVIQQIPDPVLDNNDVIIRNLVSGICGSDIAAYNHGGEKVLIFKDSEFGHEMVSEVIEVGSNVSDINVGDRVYPYPTFAKGDMMRAATVGGFSEKILIPNAQLNHNLYKVSDKISNKTAAMIEPFTVGFFGAKQASPQPGQTAVVFGSGMIGVAAAFGLRTRGVEKVLIVDISDYRLNLLKQFDFEVCNSFNENLGDKLAEYFGMKTEIFGDKADVDIFIDAVGIEQIPQQFQQFGKIGAKFVVIGIHHTPRSIDLQQITIRSQLIIGSAGYEDVDYVLEFMEKTPYKLDNLVTHEYKLDGFEAAIADAANSSAGLKVVINY
ncbi:zinc-dependent alcohol dehydrogenase [Paenibacillus sinopodophylli]|uniref:zinc-dependent alcohol dehydrogenase n=1 Tax=Paenibacillus sinopodophylli TaxID=1837342 RepID=UPI00110D1F97|nr:alcohol dehydrogenase catalytic domain-containing protein [Paenibacillus sinopodophylli]